MTTRIGLTLAVFAMLIGSTGTGSATTLKRNTLSNLAALPVGQSMRVTGFPAGPTQTATMHLQRVTVYAPKSVTYVVDRTGKHALPRSTLRFLRGFSDDGSVRVALSLNADGSFNSGSGSGAQGAFALKVQHNASGSTDLNAVRLESTLPSPDAFTSQCGNEKMLLGDVANHDLAARLQWATAARSASKAGTSTSTLRLATMAVDTDSLFMSRLFSNNTTSATNWIASMFNAMNTMYTNDLQVQLLIGTTFLRTSVGSDPYTGLAQNVSANSADLNLFSNYWKVNESAVPRSFAMLLSGAIASSGNGCSAAGIAWIDEYCQKGFTGGNNTVGSYSVNKVCTSINVDPNGTFDARIVGHEIGHNFGADHTHCTDINNGNSRVSTNTIDQCFNGEAGNGCYAGVTSCPSGQSSGSIMSYCNGSSGCATQNQLAFHPTQINQVLLPLISANTPSCLSVGDVIFANDFE